MSRCASDVARMDWTEVSPDGIRPGMELAFCEFFDADGRIIRAPAVSRTLRHPRSFAPPRGRNSSDSLWQAFQLQGPSNFMGVRIDKVGLPERCVTHGRRKAQPDAWPREAARLTRSLPSRGMRASRRLRATPRRLSRRNWRARQWTGWRANGLPCRWWESSRKVWESVVRGLGK
jgi:hypothetical protein